MTSFIPSYQFWIRGFLLYMQYDKPFKTYDELIKIMESRNIIISDRDFAMRILSDISYYTLINGYKNTFLTLDGSDNFTPGTKLEELYTIHIVDSNLCSILLKYILHIERSLKSKISYIISKNYGVFTDIYEKYDGSLEDYLYLKNYSSSNNKRKSLLRKIRACGIDSRNNLSLNHYKQTKNHIPPWILIGNVPFGLSIQWYGILRKDDKDYVCSGLLPQSTISLDHKKELLQKSLAILKDYRNSMAHGSKTFTQITSEELPRLPLLSICPSLINDEEYLKGIGKNDLFAVIIILCLLINDPYLHTNMLTDLESLFRPYIEENILFCNKSIFEVFDLPADIFDRLRKYITVKY